VEGRSPSRDPHSGNTLPDGLRRVRILTMSISGTALESEKRARNSGRGGKRVFPRAIGVAALLLSFLPPPAKADEDRPSTSRPAAEEALLFGEIPSVYGASKYEQKVTDAPSSVSIITASEIEKYGYRTLADILQSVRAFYVTYDRNYNYVGVRGFGPPGDYNTRILVLLDGHRLNDNVYDQAPVGTEFPVDVSLIDRVEIIRGPASSLYGTNAFFAVINVITKRGRDIKGAQLAGEIASFHTYKGRLTYGNRPAGGIEFLLSGSFYDSQGPRRLYYREFDDPSTNYGVAEKADGDRYYRFFSRLAFRDFSLEGSYSLRRKQIPTGSWGTVFNDPRNQTTDEAAFVDLSYDHAFENGVSLQARLGYDHFTYEGHYVYDLAEEGDPPQVAVNKDLGTGDRLNAQVQASAQVLERITLLAGSEVQLNLTQKQRSYYEDPFSELLDDRRESTIWAFFSQADYRILKNLTLNAGVRYDHYHTFGGTANPRAALIYSPFQGTTLKALFGQAFRSPNAYEFYYSDGGLTSKANPRLSPEKIRSYELVWEQCVGSRIRTVASGYYYKISNLITQHLDPSDGLVVYDNLGEIEAKGMGLEVEGRWPSGLEGRISYSLQFADLLGADSPLPNSPRSLVKFNLIAPILPEKLFAGLEVRYTSKRGTLAGREIGDFAIANLTLFSKDLLKGLEFSTSVYNLFDKRYGDPGSGEHIQDTIEQDGRTFRVKLTYSF